MGNLRHDCEKDGCYMDTLWDWEPLNDCFGGTGIRPSDLDGIVERNGHFLYLDGKRPLLNGKREIKNGHRRLYMTLAKEGPTCHVIVFHGYPPHDVRFVREWLPGGEFIPERPCDMEGLRTLVRGWFARANSGPDGLTG